MRRAAEIAIPSALTIASPAISQLSADGDAAESAEPVLAGAALAGAVGLAVADAESLATGVTVDGAVEGRAGIAVTAVTGSSALGRATRHKVCRAHLPPAAPSRQP
jgi:hypothetical protein